MIDSIKGNLKPYTIRRLRKNETIKSFDCGNDDLNDFILNRAGDYYKTKQLHIVYFIGLIDTYLQNFLVTRHFLNLYIL